MKTYQRYILILIFLDILLIVSGYLLVKSGILSLQLTDVFILTAAFTGITLLILIIFFRGQNKESESQTLHSLVALSLKFLFELVLALLWFIVAKKTSFPSVLLFFVLYLTLTLFSIWIILKTLKNKSL